MLVAWSVIQSQDDVYLNAEGNSKLCDHLSRCERVENTSETLFQAPFEKNILFPDLTLIIRKVEISAAASQNSQHSHDALQSRATSDTSQTRTARPPGDDRQSRDGRESNAVSSSQSKAPYSPPPTEQSDTPSVNCSSTTKLNEQKSTERCVDEQTSRSESQRTEHAPDVRRRVRKAKVLDLSSSLPASPRSHSQQETRGHISDTRSSQRSMRAPKNPAVLEAAGDSSAGEAEGLQSGHQSQEETPQHLNDIEDDAEKLLAFANGADDLQSQEDPPLLRAAQEDLVEELPDYVENQSRKERSKRVPTKTACNHSSDTIVADIDMERLKKALKPVEVNVTRPKAMAQRQHGKLAKDLRSEAKSEERDTERVYFSSNTEIDFDVSNLQKLSHLGISKTEDLRQCDTYVVKENAPLVRSTSLVLTTLAGKPCVTDDWLQSSIRVGKLHNYVAYLAKDAPREAKWGFSGSSSRAKSQRHAGASGMPCGDHGGPQGQTWKSLPRFAPGCNGRWR